MGSLSIWHWVLLWVALGLILTLTRTKKKSLSTVCGEDQSGSLSVPLLRL
jgi:hypothetical protein